MVRNPDWWGYERYPHNIDRIEFTPIADPEEGLAALLRGDIDLLDGSAVLDARPDRRARRA